MATALTPEQRESIVDLLRLGHSQNAIARQFKINPSTVNRIAKAEGLGGNIAATKNAIAAKAVYDLARRLELSDKFFGLVERALDEDRWLDLKDLALTFAVLVDKRRLEEGKATEIHADTDSDREFIASRVDELAARRRARLAETANASAGEAPAV